MIAPGRSVRGQALGAVAGAIGPTVGGYLTDAVSWRAVFLINLPLGAFVIVAAVLHVPETRDPTRAGGLDLRGAALATLAIGGVCFALTEASGGLTPAVIAASAAGLAAAAAFVAVERRAGTRCFHWSCSAPASSPAPTCSRWSPTRRSAA